MRPYILAETNWEAVREKNFELAVLPWGATEAHNFHLPYATDNFQIEAIASESARLAWEKGAKTIVLPNVPFGVNTGQADIHLDLNIFPSTQLAILSDILQVLERQGIKKFILLNGHGGNDFKPLLRELGLKFRDMLMITTNFFQVVDRSNYFKVPGDHADEMETSLMLFLRPDLVKSLKTAGPGKERKSRITGIREGWAWSERKWSMVTEDTGIGDPQHATAEKGEKFFAAVSERLGQLYLEVCSTDPENRYEEINLRE